MSAAGLLLNLTLAAGVALVAARPVDWRSLGEVGIGAAAALAALGILYVARAVPFVPRVTGTSLLWRNAAIEEFVKWTVVAIPAVVPTQGRYAAQRGAGFALTEQLFFLTLATPWFIFRLMLAGTLHVGTTLLYGLTVRRRAALHILMLVPGIAIHTGFNWLLPRLDQFLTVW